MGAVMKPGTIARHTAIQDGITIDGEYQVISEETNEHGGQSDLIDAQDESGGEVKRLTTL